MEDDTGGDPVRGCKWTHKTTEKVAEALRAAKIHVSANSVARLLKDMDYSLRVNLKNLESGLSKPPDPHDRDEQFRYIFSQSKEYATQGRPVISVDTKSREQVGQFCQAGRRWSRQPIEVFDHDFPSDAEGVAIPYGIYDPYRNHGFVNVGTTRDTPHNLLWTRSAHGGHRSEPNSMRVPTTCLSWLTVAAATATGLVFGNINSRSRFVTASDFM